MEEKERQVLINAIVRMVREMDLEELRSLYLYCVRSKAYKEGAIA